MSLFRIHSQLRNFGLTDEQADKILDMIREWGFKVLERYIG